MFSLLFSYLNENVQRVLVINDFAVQLLKEESTHKYLRDWPAGLLGNVMTSEAHRADLPRGGEPRLLLRAAAPAFSQVGTGINIAMFIFSQAETGIDIATCTTR